MVGLPPKPYLCRVSRQTKMPPELSRRLSTSDSSTLAAHAWVEGGRGGRKKGNKIIRGEDIVCFMCTNLRVCLWEGAACMYVCVAYLIFNIIL